MVFNISLSQMIGVGRTVYSAFTVKSKTCKAAADNHYKHAYSPSEYAMYAQNLYGRSGMRFAVILDTGVMRVFHSPVLVEDERDSPPTAMIVALLGDNILGQTYVAITPAAFTETALVLMSQYNGTVLNATKHGPAVIDLVDNNGAKVTMKGVHWDNETYPDTPNIYSWPLIHALPPTYAAHDNHDVNTPFPADTAESVTWPQMENIRQVLAYAHQHAQGNSLHRPDHPGFGAANWVTNGPGAACVTVANVNLGHNIYCGFEFLDTQSPLAKLGAAEMESLYQNPIIKEASSLATPTEVPGADTTGANPIANAALGTNAAFIAAFTGSMKAVLDNTSGGEKRTQKKKNYDRYDGTWSLLGATEQVGTTGGKIAVPGVLSDTFKEFITTDNPANRVFLVQQGLAWSQNDLQSRNRPAYYYIDLREEQINTPLATCLQTASIHSDPLQLSPAILDKKISPLN